MPTALPGVALEDSVAEQFLLRADDDADGKGAEGGSQEEGEEGGGEEGEEGRGEEGGGEEEEEEEDEYEEEEEEECESVARLSSGEFEGWVYGELASFSPV